MKQLEPTFTAKGFVHELVERTGNIAIYRRYKLGGGPEHFETIKVGSHNGFKIPGTEKTTPPAEMYPSDKQWGVKGWTFLDLADARKKAEELLK